MIALAAGAHPPDEIARFSPKLLKRTELADNDPGVRTTYLNDTQRTGMLERVRHYPAGAYRRLIALDRDFGGRGPLHEYVRSTFGLIDAEFARVVGNMRLAAAILRDSCRAGRLRFDLEPEALLLTGSAAAAPLDCEHP